MKLSSLVCWLCPALAFFVPTYPLLPRLFILLSLLLCVIYQGLTSCPLLCFLVSVCLVFPSRSLCCVIASGIFIRSSSNFFFLTLNSILSLKSWFSSTPYTLKKDMVKGLKAHQMMFNLEKRVQWDMKSAFNYLKEGLNLFCVSTGNSQSLAF